MTTRTMKTLLMLVSFVVLAACAALPRHSQGDMRGTVSYSNPAGLHRNPATAQAVATAGGRAEMNEVGGQKAVDFPGAIVGGGDIGMQATQVARDLQSERTMAVYYIGSYDIVDPNEFQKYAPLVRALLPKYGGVVLASDTAAVLVEGTARTMNAIIRFPSKEAALGLYNDPAYQEAKRIRQASTRNVSMVLVQELKAP